jgi:hypothetical protein
LIPIKSTPAKILESKMSKKDQDDQHPSDNEELLLDDQEDDEGDKVHIQDEDEPEVAKEAVETRRPKKRLSKVAKSTPEEMKKDRKQSRLDNLDRRTKE